MAAANNTKRPGNMENVYENRKTLEFGKIVSYDDKFKTLIVELSDGKTKSMTWSTFRGAWRKKSHTEMPPKETPSEEITNEEEQETPAPVVEETAEEAQPEMKPVPKRGAKLEFNGKSQNICAWGKELNIHPNTLYRRIYVQGMSIEEAFTTPVKKRGSK